MSTLGNIIWLVFGGFFAGLGYMVGGAFLCLTIVGIPLGVPIIQLGIATMSPFGREVVEEETAGGLIEVILNALWVICLGLVLSASHLLNNISSSSPFRFFLLERDYNS